ncbi:MAG TPA: hypothetical protein VMW00_00860 [Dehalococcoidales bacterium]|nr:hypothetical protein [Dehalococcoidales bacterium]
MKVLNRQHRLPLYGRNRPAHHRRQQGLSGVDWGECGIRLIVTVRQ